VGASPRPAGRAKATRAADVVIVAYSALSDEEREEAFTKINDARLSALAGSDDEIAIFIRSLQRVADVVDDELTPTNYRVARRTLLADGEEIAEFNAVVRFFGSWLQAKEALALADVNTPRKIQARFRSRLVGKVHRYREDSLREAVTRCAADLGHVPLVIEYEHWRQRELELAKARGEELFLPSDSPYRRRWGGWEQALLHFGFTPAAIADRLEPGRERSNESLSHFRYGS
jgi:hypothetical protein